MTQSNATKRRPGRWTATLFALAIVGIAVAVIAISTVGGKSKSSNLRAARGQAPAVVHAAKKPAVRAAKTTKPAAPVRKAAKPAAPAAPVTPPQAAATPTPNPAAQAPAPAPQPAPAPAPAAKPTSGVPQNNGGDADPDNNGGPDDGDGGI